MRMRGAGEGLPQPRQCASRYAGDFSPDALGINHWQPPTMGYHFRHLDNGKRTVRTTQSHNAARITPSKRGSELLDALEEMVLREGFASLGVSEIANRLCCSKRTLYDLAPSKHALVLLILQRFFARIRSDAALACETSNDARQSIYAFLQVGVRAAEHLSPATVADIHCWPPARAIWQEHVRMRVEGLTHLIDSGTRNGVFRKIPPAFVAEVVFASINRLREPDFYEFTDLTISEAFDELYSMLLAALTTDEASENTETARHTPRPSRGPQRARD